MGHHLKTFFQQRLKPQHELGLRHHALRIEVRVCSLRDDVKAIRVYPVGPADHLIRLKVEGIADEVSQCLVGAGQPAARLDED